jgi:hypothetical protein
MNANQVRLLGQVCFVGGFASIIASIAAWYLFKQPDAAHGERFGIFIGLWAPTFFVLSDRFDRHAAKLAAKT